MREMKKRIWIILLIMLFVFSGCSEEKKTKPGQDAEVTKTQADTGGTELQESELAGESKQELTLEQIQALSQEAVALLYYYNQEKEYNAGMCFVVDSPKHGKVLLKDAFRLWPYDGEVLAPEKFAGFVQGGALLDMETGDGRNVFLKNCFLLNYKQEAVDKNVAAFTLQGEGEVKALTLADEMPVVEDKVYLLAGDQVYEGKVDTILLKEATYSFEGLEGNTNGYMTGAPIVNAYGEVIGSYLGIYETAGKRSYFGIKLVGFGDKIEQADIADITYPVDFGENEVSSVYTNTNMFTCKQRIESHYFDILIHGAFVTDELEGHKCKEGYKYLAMEMTFVNSPNVTGENQTYYGDFQVEWPYNEKALPETEELLYGQLSQELVVTDRETRGVMIFQVPEDRIRVKFTFLETYPDEDADKIVRMYNIVYIPVENWTR